MFDGITERLNLRLTRAQAFRYGNVFLSYVPAARGGGGSF